MWDEDRAEYEERAAIELNMSDYTFLQPGPGGLVPRDTEVFFLFFFLLSCFFFFFFFFGFDCL